MRKLLKRPISVRVMAEVPRRNPGGAGRAKQPRKEETQEVKNSKALSYILRHGAEKEGLCMRDDGFIRVDAIVCPQLFVCPPTFTLIVSNS